MIQGTINQLLAMGAAVKKAYDITKEKEAKVVEKQQKAIAKEQAAKDKAMARMRDKVQAKWNQNEEYKRFRESLGVNKAPEGLERIVYEKWNSANEKMKKAGQDLSRFSPEAQAAIIREVNK